MNEFFKLAVELLAAVMPDSDAGKLGTFLILAFLVLTATGRFKLEWIGTGSRHVFRWLRCKVRDKHHWQPQYGVHVSINGEPKRPTVCLICGKRGTRE